MHKHACYLESRHELARYAAAVLGACGCAERRRWQEMGASSEAWIHVCTEVLQGQQQRPPRHSPAHPQSQRRGRRAPAPPSAPPRSAPPAQHTREEGGNRTCASAARGRRQHDLCQRSTWRAASCMHMVSALTSSAAERNQRTPTSRSATRLRVRVLLVQHEACEARHLARPPILAPAAAAAAAPAPPAAAPTALAPAPAARQASSLPRRLVWCVADADAGHGPARVVGFAAAATATAGASAAAASAAAAASPRVRALPLGGRSLAFHVPIYLASWRSSGRGGRGDV
jgi:hypothetical protein